MIKTDYIDGRAKCWLHNLTFTRGFHAGVSDSIAFEDLDEEAVHNYAGIPLPLLSQSNV